MNEYVPHRTSSILVLTIGIFQEDILIKNVGLSRGTRKRRFKNYVKNDTKIISIVTNSKNVEKSNNNNEFKMFLFVY